MCKLKLNIVWSVEAGHMLILWLTLCESALASLARMGEKAADSVWS